MRHLISMIIALALAGMPQAIAKSGKKNIIEHTWRGVSTTSSTYTKSGELIIKRTISLALNNDNKVSGTCACVITMGGKEYNATSRFHGQYDPKDKSVYIADDDWIQSDALPTGLQWCKCCGTLWMTDEPAPGKHALQGRMVDNCNQIHQYMLVD